ncbi:MAG: NACHT domain-containing protein, partial [Bryobacteraceae bacterium]
RKKYHKHSGAGHPQPFAKTTQKFKNLTADLASAIDRILAGLPTEKATPQDLTVEVNSTREALKPYIKDLCGTMKVLDMSHPIELASLYTDVHIMRMPEHLRHLPMEELLKRVDSEGVGRLNPGGVEPDRLRGFDAVTQFPRLLVLGKPGAGKTTYLKRLAFQCATGDFRSDLVPCFLTLRDFADSPAGQSLPDFILALWAKRSVGRETAQALLRGGRVLLLLDGLDEVRQEHFERVRKQVEAFCDDYPDGPVVMTCRIAAAQYRFARFTEVEMADFDLKQINQFSENWFRVRNKPEKTAPFQEKLSANPAVRELATSPLLLTMLCLVFEDRTDLEGNRADLYDKGLEVLLNKWDGGRGIARDWPYKGLTTFHRRSLLSEIAFHQFRQGANFFKENVIEKQIADYFQDRPSLPTSDQPVDAHQVLKAVEAQHGLLVERTQGIYSFSHLTFQEYLTAQRVRDKQSLVPEFVGKVADPKWREVLLLAASMVDPEDFIPQMKASVDRLIAGQKKIQEILAWARRKESSAERAIRREVVRSFYFALARDFDLALARALAQVLSDLARDLDRATILARDLVRDIARNLALALARDLDGDLAHDLTRDLDRALARDLDRDPDFGPDFGRALSELRQELPDSKDQNFRAWWRDPGPAWTKRLRQTLVANRDIGHDWQLTPGEKSLMDDYIYANRTLVACLKGTPGLKESTKQWVLDTLLLPETELKEYPRP